MTNKRKLQFHIASAVVMLCLTVWIVMLYAARYREEKAWENQFMTRYRIALNDIFWHSSQFEELKSFEDQLSCLETLTDDLTQLKAYMEMHMNLTSISMPKAVAASAVNTSAWHDVETVAGFIHNGGTLNSYSITAFRADGTISEEEAAIIRLLKDEMSKLYSDMWRADEDGVNYEYALSSLEVYQRLTEIMQRMIAELVRLSQ